jgi:uncharacterized protein YbaR (Trm112 family)
MDKMVEELLACLRCPEKLVPLRAASPKEIKALNDRIAKGEVLDVGGSKVEEPVEEGLVREGDDLLYRVQKGIPILIIEEGIVL